MLSLTSLNDNKIKLYSTFNKVGGTAGTNYCNKITTDNKFYSNLTNRQNKNSEREIMDISQIKNIKHFNLEQSNNFIKIMIIKF